MFSALILLFLATWLPNFGFLVVEAFKSRTKDPRKPKIESLYPLEKVSWEVLRTGIGTKPYLICTQFTVNLSDHDFPHYQAIELTRYLDLLNTYVTDCASISPFQRQYYKILNTHIHVLVDDFETADWSVQDLKDWDAYEILFSVKDDVITPPGVVQPEEDVDNWIEVHTYTKFGLCFALLSIRNFIESFNVHYLPLLTPNDLENKDVRVHVSNDQADLAYGIWMRNNGITNRPNYTFRAWELDTGNEYIEKEVIKKNIELAALARFNSVVWKFYSPDIFSFVLPGVLFPHGPDCDVLTKSACKGLSCDGCGYNEEDILDIIKYAQAHGQEIHFSVQIPQLTGSFDPDAVQSDPDCSLDAVIDPYGVTCYGPGSRDEMTCSATDYASPLHCRSPPCHQLNFNTEQQRPHTEQIVSSYDELFVNGVAVRKYITVVLALKPFLLYQEAGNEWRRRGRSHQSLLFVGMHLSPCQKIHGSWYTMMLNLLASLSLEIKAKIVINYGTLQQIQSKSASLDNGIPKAPFQVMSNLIVPWFDTGSTNAFTFIHSNTSPYIASHNATSNLSCGPRGHPLGVGLPDSECNIKLSAEQLYLGNHPNDTTYFDYYSLLPDENGTPSGSPYGMNTNAMGGIARMDSTQVPSNSLSNTMWPRAAAVGGILWNGEGTPTDPTEINARDEFWVFYHNLVNLEYFTFGLGHDGYETAGLVPLYCTSKDVACYLFRLSSVDVG